MWNFDFVFYVDQSPNKSSSFRPTCIIRFRGLRWNLKGGVFVDEGEVYVEADYGQYYKQAKESWAAFAVFTGPQSP